MGGQSRAGFRFGQYEVDVRAHELRKNGTRVRLQEQPFQVLLALLEAPGEIVTREQLRQRLWPEGTFVEFDHALNTAVKKIRAALCDNACIPRYVETIPRHGYRFVSELNTFDTPSKQTTGPEDVVGKIPALRNNVRRIAAATVLGSAILLLLFAGWRMSPLHTGDDIVVAVLPFSDMNAGSSHDSLSTELPRALGEQLQRTRSKHVVVSAHRGKDDLGDHAANATTGKVDYVLQGGVVEDDRRVHVAVQLIRIHDQSYVWSENFDGKLDEAGTETKLASDIVRRLQPTLDLLSESSR